MGKNFQELVEILKIFEESGVNVMEYSKGDLSVKLEKHTGKAPAVETFDECVTPGQEKSKPVCELSSEKDGISVKASVVGVFYEAKEPGAKPFVKLGDKVEEGQVLCILESMKMMLEIKAPQAGIIKEINFKNGDLVEYDAQLFFLENYHA